MKIINIPLAKQDGAIRKIFGSKFKDAFIEFSEEIFDENKVKVVDKAYYESIEIDWKNAEYENYQDLLKVFSGFSNTYSNSLAVPITYIEIGGVIYLTVKTDKEIENSKVNLSVSMPVEVTSWIYGSEDINSIDQDDALQLIANFLPIVFYIEED